jgi:hypothetical protein
MTIGSSILLIAVGAILKWAVTAHVNGVDLHTVGTILFVLGILGLVLAIAYTFRDSFGGGRGGGGVPPDEQDTRYHR